MSSSISNSEPTWLRRRAAWLFGDQHGANDARGASVDVEAAASFARTTLASACALFGILYAFVLACDPYDTGKFNLFTTAGSWSSTPFIADVRLGRDPDYQAAVIGNSTAALISPARLSAQTGRRFVSLAMAALGPIEDLMTARWFMRHRKSPADYVFVIDDMWCQPVYREQPARYYPHWLYTDDALTYLAGLVKSSAVVHAWRRLAFAAARRPSEAYPDGFWNFETERTWKREKVLGLTVSLSGGAAELVQGQYPALPHLAEFLTALPADSGIVLLVPPVFERMLPAPGSSQEAAFEGCKRTARDLLQGRRRTAFIDHRVRDEITSKLENFWDLVHYRGNVAELLENEIAATIRAWN